MNKVVLIISLLYFPLVFSQSKEDVKRLAEVNKLLYEAEKKLEDGNFSAAEAAYRKAIAMDEKNVLAHYNLGTAFYNNKKNSEAGKQFVEAAKYAETKSDKHKIYHNLGNVLMNQKNYGAAVEAYKNALRNNPKDDETRYNLALAKKMLEEQGGGGEDEQQDQDQNQDQNQDQQDQGDNQEDQNGGNDNNDNEDKGDEGDKQEENQQQQEESSDQQQEQPDEGEQQQQPVVGQLSQQQIQSLLEAIENEDKKAQDKINVEKQKGIPVKPEKDW